MDNIPCHFRAPCLRCGFCGRDDRFGELYTMDGKSRLLDQMCEWIRLKHYSIRTEKVYCEWVKRFIRFHQYRHPQEMGAAEVEAFLTDLAVRRNVSASTQNQALAALLFLYREVLQVDLPWLKDVVRAKKLQRLPVVLSVEEVRRVLAALEGDLWLVCSLLESRGFPECAQTPSCQEANLPFVWLIRRVSFCGAGLERAFPPISRSAGSYWERRAAG